MFPLEAQILLQIFASKPAFRSEARRTTRPCAGLKAAGGKVSINGDSGRNNNRRQVDVLLNTSVSVRI